MNLTEKSAYIKGLAEGLELDKTTKEGKILAALLELVDDLAAEVAGIKEDIDGLGDRLDKVEAKLETDKKRIDDAKECNHVLTKGMLALLEHGINGNNIDQMRDAKNGVEAYLINH